MDSPKKSVGYWINLILLNFKRIAAIDNILCYNGAIKKTIRRNPKMTFFERMVALLQVEMTTPASYGVWHICFLLLAVAEGSLIIASTTPALTWPGRSISRLKCCWRSASCPGGGAAPPHRTREIQKTDGCGLTRKEIFHEKICLYRRR